MRSTYQEKIMYEINNGKARLMTVKEVAYYLKISVSKVYAMANANQIPAVRVGRSWRFKQDVIDEWIQQGCVRQNRESVTIMEDMVRTGR